MKLAGIVYQEIIPHKDMSKHLTFNLRPFLYIHIWVSRSGPSALGILPSPKTPVTTLQLYKFLCQFSHILSAYAPRHAPGRLDAGLSAL